MSKKLTLIEMKNLAKQKEGLCLSEEYVNAKTKLKWQCRNGHQWYASPDKIKNKGSWCYKCHWDTIIKIKKEDGLSVANKIANQRGGQCISKSYINTIEKLEWKCADGHIFKMRLAHVLKNSWCPKCNFYYHEEICRNLMEHCFKESFPKSKPYWLLNKRKNRMELDGYSEKLSIGFEYNGEQHFIKVNYLSKSLAKIKQHDFEKANKCREMGVKLFVFNYFDDFNDLISLLKQKATELQIDVNKLDLSEPDFKNFKKNQSYLNEFEGIAKKKKGKLLSKIYVNEDTKLEFQCKNGHIFESKPSNIRRNTWCKICSGKAKKSINDYINHAKNKGGDCLSKEYSTNKQKLTWKCKKGHIWEAQAKSVLHGGRWCPKCADVERGLKKRKYTIIDAKNLAIKKGGKCLSEQYKVTRDKLTWECDLGHQWNAKFENILFGKWCPRCKRRKK